ncbi:MAG TPA: MFS transporter [Gammaproteobacteria bacterium]|nr:MFS transporter [Gammaproteobacteria bacterium]
MHVSPNKTHHPALAWIVTLTASLFFFYGFIQLNLFSAINAQLMQEFGLSASQLGQLASMYFYGNALFLFPAGLLLDRFSTKKLLLLAVTLSTAGTFGFGLSSSYLSAAVARFIVGAGAAFCFLSCIRLASRWFPASRMAFVTGIIVTMAMIGGMVAQTPMTLLSNSVGWRHAIWLDGALGVLVLIATLFIVRDYPPDNHSVAREEHAKLKAMGLWRSMLYAVINPQNWLGGIYASLLNLPVFLLGALWGINYLTEVHHISAVEASYATTLFFVGVIFGSPVYGWFSDYIGLRRLPMIIGAILSLIVIAVLMYMPNLSLISLIFLFFLIGFTTSSQVLAYPTVAELNPSALTSTAVSITSMTIMCSGFIFQPLFGWMMEMQWDRKMVNGMAVYSANDFNNAMLIIPLGFVAGLIIALFIKETYCRTLDFKVHENQKTNDYTSEYSDLKSTS